LEPRYEVGNAPSSVVSGDLNDYGHPDVGGAISENLSDEDTDTIHAERGQLLRHRLDHVFTDNGRAIRHVQRVDCLRGLIARLLGDHGNVAARQRRNGCQQGRQQGDFG